MLQAQTVVIDATRPVLRVDPYELWDYRDLFYVLVTRDLKLRYRQTFLGVTWAVLQPVLPMIVFTLLFGRLAHMPADGLPYPIFVFSGLLPWTFFNTAVTNATTSVVSSAGFVTKVYFPRLLLPGASVFGGMIDLAISGVIFLAMMLYYHLQFRAHLLLIPTLLLLMTLVTLSVGMLTSSLYVKYRDVRHALPFVLQLWMYLTPVIYPVSFIPARFRWLLDFNPLSGIIQAFRSAFFGQPLHWSSLALAAGLTAILFLIALRTFRQMEREMADVI